MLPWHCDTSNSHGDSTVVHRVGVDCGGGICSWVVEFHSFVENILGALTMLGPCKCSCAQAFAFQRPYISVECCRSFESQ